MTETRKNRLHTIGGIPEGCRPCERTMTDEKQLKGLIEWMDELIIDEKRDERILFGLWQSLKEFIKTKMELKNNDR